MTTDTEPALHLRRQIANTYLRTEPPPGQARATWFVAALRRAPRNADFLAMARDFIAAIELYERLSAALAAARAAGDAATGLVLHGLLGHATAELIGSTENPGWRAAALDILDPDGHVEPPIAHADAVRLFALALGIDPDQPDPDDETD